MTRRTRTLRFLAVASAAALVGGLSAPTANASAGTSASLQAPITPGSAAKTVQWPQFHGRPNHRGFNAAEDTVGADNVSSLALSWIGDGEFTSDDLVSESSPAVVDGYAYFGTVDGQLLAFSTDCPAGGTCEPAWRVDLGQNVRDSPAVVDGVLYVGTSNSDVGRLYAFDVKKCAAAGGCEPMWEGKVDDNGSSPTVINGVVYVGSYDNGLYAFPAAGCGRAMCDPLWVGHTDGYVINSPAVAKGVAYVGDSTGLLYAFRAKGCHAATCSATWTANLGAPIYEASPVVHGGTVYVASSTEAPDSHLEAFKASGCGKAVCKPRWISTGGDYFTSAPAVAYGHVYLGSGTGELMAFKANGCGHPTCAPDFTGRAAGAVATMASAPMVANGVVYIGENTGLLYGFPAHGCGAPGAQCDALWQYTTEDPIVDSSPVMVNGTLYLAGNKQGAFPELYVFTLGGA